MCERCKTLPYTTLMSTRLNKTSCGIGLRRNVKAGETGDPRENPPTSGLVRGTIPTRENPGVTPPGIEPGSPWGGEFSIALIARETITYREQNPVYRDERPSNTTPALLQEKRVEIRIETIRTLSRGAMTLRARQEINASLTRSARLRKTPVDSSTKRCFSDCRVATGRVSSMHLGYTSRSKLCDVTAPEFCRHVTSENVTPQSRMSASVKTNTHHVSLFNCLARIGDAVFDWRPLSRPDIYSLNILPCSSTQPLPQGALSPQHRLRNFPLCNWDRDGLAVRQLAPPHRGEHGSIPGRATPGFSKVGIVPDDAAVRRVFSGISRFLHPFILALLHSHLTAPALALKTSMNTHSVKVISWLIDVAEANKTDCPNSSSLVPSVNKVCEDASTRVYA
ncbi:hypothetical protein PR048_033176 [Dryococelus australis]|uniref:Uncharacterized protein n=1 Tax=Dryococelus australis TaxID=614101 RepID=A0ABQ9FZI7_9NEOP|nr:hypothetical protein PR048_033176 [Dryococelus australis]